LAVELLQKGIESMHKDGDFGLADQWDAYLKANKLSKAP
jgi:hypothetical protein